MLCPRKEEDPIITQRELKWYRETKEHICAKIFNDAFCTTNKSGFPSRQ